MQRKSSFFRQADNHDHRGIVMPTARIIWLQSSTMKKGFVIVAVTEFDCCLNCFTLGKVQSEVNMLLLGYALEKKVWQFWARFLSSNSKVVAEISYFTLPGVSKLKTFKLRLPSTKFNLYLFFNTSWFQRVYLSFFQGKRKQPFHYFVGSLLKLQVCVMLLRFGRKNGQSKTLAFDCYLAYKLRKKATWIQSLFQP